MGSDMDQWRIEYIPGKPPVPPDQQPTGTFTGSSIKKKRPFCCQLNV